MLFRSIADVAKAIGVQNVVEFNPVRDGEKIKSYLEEKLATNELTLIILKQPCLLAAANLAKMKKA